MLSPKPPTQTPTSTLHNLNLNFSTTKKTWVVFQYSLLIWWNLLVWQNLSIWQNLPYENLYLFVCEFLLNSIFSICIVFPIWANWKNFQIESICKKIKISKIFSLRKMIQILWFFVHPTTKIIKKKFFQIFLLFLNLSVEKKDF